MRVLVCGSELGLGFVVARRLLAEGHKVSILTGFEDLLPNLRKNKLAPLLGQVEDPAVQQHMAKVDPVIDVELPLTFLREKVHVSRLRPSLLKKSLAGSNKTLIVTSHPAVLGNTGPTPLHEDARPRPLPGFAWLPRLENEILQQASRYLPYAERLTYSHALSGDRARSLGWRPSRGSILLEIERAARERALASQLPTPRTRARKK